MTWLARLLLGVALTAALVLAAGAGAASLSELAVPNPGFESAVCPSLPCPGSWGSTGTATAERVTDQFHHGTASLHLDSTPSGGAASARSDCVGGVSAGATYYFSFWYRTTDTKVDQLEGRFELWNNSGTCANSTATQDLDINDPITDGAWHFVQGSGQLAPAGSVAFNVQLQEICIFNMFDCEAWYDDIRIGTSPTTAVRVTSLAAHRGQAGVDLTWRAPSNAETLGFNVWRSDARGVQYSKVNRVLVLGRGTAYQYRDRTALAGKGYVYKLQLVRPDGSRTWAGTLGVRAMQS